MTKPAERGFFHARESDTSACLQFSLNYLLTRLHAPFSIWSSRPTSQAQRERQMPNVPSHQNQRPVEYAVAILRDCALTHADLKVLIGLIGCEVGDIASTGQYEGYETVSEHLDNAFDAMDKCYAAGVTLEDEAKSEAQSEWRAEARAFNREAA